MSDGSRIRNFSIIAHIDHGKSTLADRLLELTGAVNARSMRAQYLDSMDLERERGITIKLKPIRMAYQGFALNLIDTPGHVDFTYEVSRSLAAVEGAVMIVDATQGVEAQTVANLYLALDQGLAIIPVVNKIDLPNARVDLVRSELAKLIGIDPAEVLAVSAKTGQGVSGILDRIIRDIPPPSGDGSAVAKALIFDSHYDDYQGVVASVRVVDGALAVGQDVLHVATGERSTILELGYYEEKLHPTDRLAAGEIGYVISGLRNIQSVQVGDTVTDAARPAAALPGYRQLMPMVFAALFPQAGDEYSELRESLYKLKLNDAALQFEPEHSPAMGHGFRCGFLGMLHLEIVEERLEREFGVTAVVTVPSVGYRVVETDGQSRLVSSPLELPDPSRLVRVEEPVMNVTIVTPSRYVGPVMQAAAERRGRYRTTEYLDADRAVLHYELPLTSLIIDFHDTLKSTSQGYASMQYDFLKYEPTDVIRLDIRVADEPVEALATIVYRNEAYTIGRRLVDRLKEVLPRQQFEVKVQAAIGGQIIAASRLPALRKDVTAKLYGGDVTRKRKLLEKQKKGKRRLRAHGHVAIPPSAFSSLLRR